jgi:murein DD-endopeptidase MepM/ murein hydrolase activator NlpD
MVQSGDTLGKIAQNFQISLEAIIKSNDLINPNLLSVGQVLTIPVPILSSPGPEFKVIPDSELVYSPMSVNFDVEEFINSRGGYLSSYEEEVEGQLISGGEIMERVAREFSVNPRLLLAVLEYQSGWVTRAEPAEETLDFPLGFPDTWREGLYLQLAWAANNLNRGYYLWRVGGVGTWITTDNAIIPISPLINSGTAGVQGFFVQLYTRDLWENAVSEDGLFTVYSQFFGYPFDMAIEPIVPNSLMQPQMQLPFEPNLDWAFTGGPHGAWGDGSAWGALDFAPPGEALGCVTSNEWVVAVADGQIIRAETGAVVQDLDGDGVENTGWAVLYMHIESRDRVRSGTYLRAGERVGHPSCEGGVSSGTHVHLARKYNGEWIPSDQRIPFVLDGWISRGTGVEYDGYLLKEGRVVEAWEGYFPENMIRKDP